MAGEKENLVLGILHNDRVSPLDDQGVTNCYQISYAPPEILFEITEITRFSKSEIKKIDMATSKIL